MVAGITAAVFMLFVVMPLMPGARSAVSHGVVGIQALIAHADGEGGDGGGAGEGGGASNGGSTDSNGAGAAVGGDCACGGAAATGAGSGSDSVGGADNATPTQVVTPTVTPVVTPPSPPTNLSAVCSSAGTTATVSWSLPSNATRSWFGVGAQSGFAAWSPYTISVTPGTNHWVWVNACNASGCSAPVGINVMCQAPVTPPPTQCPTGYTLQNGVCVPPVQNCPTGYTLQGTTCVPPTQNCPTGYTLQGASCVPTIQNCPSGYTKVGNTCVPPTQNCPAGYTLQGTTCVPPVQNCPSGYTKVGNTCVPPTQNCPSGYTLQNGTCVPTIQTCPAGYTLQGATCVPTIQNCPTGYTKVGNTCVPPTQCASGYSLQNGVCVPPNQNCPSGYTMQNGVCVPPIQTTTPATINNNNNNTNNNNNSNTNTVTINSPAPAQAQVIYLNQPTPNYYTPPVYTPPVYQPPYNYYNNYNYPTCSLTAYPSTISFGQVATLSWSSNYATGGWISNVGNVNQNGSVQVTPSRSMVYTGTFTGQNGQTITCSTSVNVQGYAYPVVQNTAPINPVNPYITLAAVPYTGLDMGPFGQVVYWSFLALCGLLGVYLIGVRHMHRDIALWLQGKSKGLQLNGR